MAMTSCPACGGSKAVFIEFRSFAASFDPTAPGVIEVDKEIIDGFEQLFCATCGHEIPGEHIDVHFP